MKFIANSLIAIVIAIAGISRSTAGETYEYDAQGRLTTVTYSDSMSITYTYDNNGNILSIIVEGNQAPGAFARLLPEDNSTVVQPDSVVFSWSKAIDPNGDAVTYTLKLNSAEIDTSFTTQDTTFTVNFLSFGLVDGQYSVTWSVSASDGQLTTEPANGQGLFTLDIATAVEEPTTALPTEFALAQNYPNPFNPYTQIKYELPVTANVKLTLYNVLGKQVRTLVDKEQPAGFYSVQWDGLNEAGARVASGIYIYYIEASGSGEKSFIESRKMLLLK